MKTQIIATIFSVKGGGTDRCVDHNFWDQVCSCDVSFRNGVKAQVLTHTQPIVMQFRNATEAILFFEGTESQWDVNVAMPTDHWRQEARQNAAVLLQYLAMKKA